MAREAINIRDARLTRVTAGGSISAGQVVQAPNGEAAVWDSTAAASSGARIEIATADTYTIAKNTSVAILDGGPVYWDYSANEATYRKNNDRDFYLGTAAGDSPAGDTTINVKLNAQPTYLIDLARDAFISAITGTQALNGLAILRRGGAHNFVLSSTSEAQKLDALSVDGFSKDANAIIEGAFRVIDDGSGSAPDISIGIANATHATDADSITESLFIHLDGNDVNIYAESDDGTTEVAATDTTVNYTAGTRVEFWMDMRDPADIQIYLDGVLVLGSTTFSLNAATGPLKLLVHQEKTSAADIYELAVDWLRVRIQE